ncbi:coniferyl alcohol acyltransferase-like [Hibiscus syriacus]|uniref:coniferyl alcohol acyltransferase-like n=1 Tax=Hibiscus syriacus TaxID=106335 RepID=UPI00192126F3|nr:coniferyl alcohol acyltransferase-like [Hibiscus syriacus]
MGSTKGEFTATVTKNEVVAALLPFQEHWLPLTNLDLLLPPLDFGVFFCYKKPLSTGCCMVTTLKKALAEALLPYYGLAGEVVPNAMGEPELLCNNRGVDFVEAYADIELRNLNYHNPHESIQGKLVPKKKRGVLSVQIVKRKPLFSFLLDTKFYPEFYLGLLVSDLASVSQEDASFVAKMPKSVRLFRAPIAAVGLGRFSNMLFSIIFSASSPFGSWK